MIKKFGEKKIEIRELQAKDLKQTVKFQKFVNELVVEDAKILVCTKKTRKEETEWLKDHLTAVKKKSAIYLVAEHNGIIAGSAHIKLQSERHSHIGEFGIAIDKDYQGIGLGAYLMQEVIRLAKKRLKPKLKILRLSVYQGNMPAINLYKKIGFKEVARVPKQVQFQDKLIDEIIMLLEIN